MKLGTLKSATPDGDLVVISQDHQWAVKVPNIAAHFQQALDRWDQAEAQLLEVYNNLNQGKLEKEAIAVQEKDFHSPLPRAYQWLDGSAFIQHIILVRKARGAAIPETLKTVPLMYQGGSDNFLTPTADIPCISVHHGLDFEAEVGVITDFVPMGTKAENAAKHIKFFVIINDVTLRGLVPEELKQGFGFFQSKPSSAFAPFALTPDELGEAYKDGRIHLPLHSTFNGKFFGNPDAGAMHFSFFELIEHAARTRSLTAGTIIGSGTVANEDTSRGSSCLAEKRMLEKIETGKIQTPFMEPGDTIKIKMHDAQGKNLFGTIEQKVVRSEVQE